MTTGLANVLPSVGTRQHTTGRAGLVLALIALLITPIFVHGVLNADPAHASQQTAATPAGTPIATPGSDADTRCSVVLGIGDEGDACVAIVNAVLLGDAVDFTVPDAADTTATGVGAGEYVDFVAVPAGDESAVEVTDTAAPDVVIADAALDLAPDIAYVIVLEQVYDESTPTLTAVPFDLAPLGTDEARVAFHHAVSDADQLSVLGLDAPSDEGILPGETTDPIDLTGGDYEIDVVPGNAPDQTLATLNVQLEADISYLVIMGGSTGDQTVTVIYAAAPVATRP